MTTTKETRSFARLQYGPYKTPVDEAAILGRAMGAAMAYAVTGKPEFFQSVEDYKKALERVCDEARKGTWQG